LYFGPGAASSNRATSSGVSSGHAFNSGAVRVQFTVDARNERSQAAVTKLGAVKEGILRHDTRTWTGHIRDTVVFSILDSEWPTVKVRLEQRLAKLTG
jgi:hypothetical protein